MPISNATPHDNDRSIGERLRVARESRGIQLVDIAGTLCIKPQFLAALEADQPEALPTPTHASGFLRSYAQYLGVDVSTANIAPPIPRDIAPVSPTRAKPDWLTTILPPLLVIGGLIVIYALWQWLQPPEAPPIAPPPAALTAPKLEPLEPKIEPKVELAVDPVPPATTVPQPEAKVETPPVSPADKAAPSVPVADAAKSPAAVTAKADSIVVRAIADAWVQITDATGRQLYSRLMRAGESWRAPQQAGLRLSTGNAGGLTIVRNGEAGAPLGAQAQVVRNLALTQSPAAAIKPAAAKAVTPSAATTADDADTGETAGLEE